MSQGERPAANASATRPEGAGGDSGGDGQQQEEGKKVHPAVLIGFFVAFVALMVLAAVGMNKLFGGDEEPQGKSPLSDLSALMAGGQLGGQLDALARGNPFTPPAGNRVDPARLDALLRIRQRLLPAYNKNLDMLRHMHESSTDRKDRPGFDTIGMLASLRREHVAGLQAEGMALAEYGWLASLVFERVLPPAAEVPSKLKRPAGIPRCEGAVPDDVAAEVKERAWSDLRLEYLDDLLIATPLK